MQLELKKTWALRGGYSQGLALPSVSLQVEQVIVRYLGYTSPTVRENCLCEGEGVLIPL